MDEDEKPENIEVNINQDGDIVDSTAEEQEAKVSTVSEDDQEQKAPIEEEASAQGEVKTTSVEVTPGLKEEPRTSQSESDDEQTRQVEDQVPPSTPARSNTDSLDTSTQAPIVKSKDSSNTRATIAIILAVVVAVGLIGVGYIAFLSQESSVENSNIQNEESQAQTDNSGVIDAENIESEIDQVDEALSEIDDTTDFPQDELSDDNLGL